jgi:hypothetical protein
VTTYTIEIDGRAIAAFTADNEGEAKSFIDQQWLRYDLSRLESSNLPLWDGKQDILHRPAMSEEAAIFQTSYTEAVKRNEIHGRWLAYLVAVSDPFLEDDDEVEG